jgi:hypothetical protein
MAIFFLRIDHGSQNTGSALFGIFTGWTICFAGAARQVLTTGILSLESAQVCYRAIDFAIAIDLQV